ncbi:MAG: hypothetical protein KatS3mg027_0212 [Bacteroidia bacterium]|nr:MAG: hypothetical protein KatS3mg027_0212 [Bacteroidia bacterium]
MPAIQPSIEIGGISIGEPVTTLTDIIVSIVCFYAFFKLSLFRNKQIYFFRRYFLLMGLATLYGGIIGHGFIQYLSFSWKLPGWLLSMVSMNFLERAMIEYLKQFISVKWGKILTIWNLMELMFFSFITIYAQEFFYVEVHAAYGLLCIVLPISAYLYRKQKDETSKYFLMATFVMMVTSIIFKNKISIDIWFNYNDIAHVLMAITGWLFYEGIKKSCNSNFSVRSFFSE